MKRPELNNNISIKDFKDFYWLKQELMSFCKERGICRTGGKLELSSRIEKHLTSGEIVTKSQSAKKTSTFNWSKEVLTEETLINDSYRNSENLRTFFKKYIGEHFKFNVEFIAWVKLNNGKTLAEAAIKWIEIVETKKDKNNKTVIAPQFEYNTYIRDFMNDNPNLSFKDAVACWKAKRFTSTSRKYLRDDIKQLSK